MSENTSLAIHNPVTPAVWQMISSVAPAMHASRLFGVSSPEQAMAIMLKGHELGLSLTASFEFIHVISGKPSISPRGALALIHNAPQLEAMKITRLADAKDVFTGYECHMKRKDGIEHTARFTVKDAQQAGLVKKDSGWDKYPENMCLWRAVGFAADVVFPDVIGGLKRGDEFGANIDQAGNIVDGAWEVELSEPTEPDHNAILSGLVSSYGAEVVMAANGGTIPTTPEEVAMVAEKLAAQGQNA